ncbi:MAG TPA: hypothetical protein VLG16_01150 [Candidatus Saccharimonadales bacterium]|nr:hypothetical protein [Candidatus Saccharimonadales bacterium]
MDISFDEQQVIRDLGLENSDVAFQRQVITRIGALLSEQLMQRFQLEMTPEDYKTFAEVADDDVKAQAWIVARFPEYQKWVAENLASIIALMQQQANTALNAVHEHREQQK